jgi:hypothetical protein
MPQATRYRGWEALGRHLPGLPFFTEKRADRSPRHP